MTVIPLEDRILVRPAEPLTAYGQTGTAFGGSDHRLVRGTVIAAGTGPRDVTSRATPPVQAGDTILFTKDCGCEVAFGGVHYRMLKSTDVVDIEAQALTVELYRAEPRLIRSRRL